MEQGLGLHRHHLMKILMVVGAVTCVPIEWCLINVVEGQKEAVDGKWVATPCRAEKTLVGQIPKAKKGMFTGKNEYKPMVLYSYLHDGIRRTSSRVYYYGDEHPGKLKGYVERVVDFIEKKCTAYVNPADPDESILIPEAAFRPYGNIWLHAGLLLGVFWYAIFEHNWQGHPELLEKYPKSDDWKISGHSVAAPPRSDTYYLLAALPGIHEWWQVFCGAVIVVIWQVIAVHVWADFEGLNHAPGSDELRVIFHALGGMLGVRLLYFASLACRVKPVQLFIDREQVRMGSPFELLFKQDRRGWFSVLYKKVDITFSLTETKHGKREGRKPARRVARLHEEPQSVLVDHALKPSATGVITSIPFDSHVARLELSTDELRVYHRWVIDMQVHLRFVPVSYNQSIPIAVDVPEELKPRED